MGLLSFHPPGPILAWFPEEERFEAHWSTWIEAVRYRCERAGFTRADWARKPGRFPTRQQVLADDLLRCPRLLSGETVNSVKALLGRASARSRSHGRIYLDYLIGWQRDSFFQLDSEYLSIRFSRQKAFRSASIYQG